MSNREILRSFKRILPCKLDHDEWVEKCEDLVVAEQRIADFAIKEQKIKEELKLEKSSLQHNRDIVFRCVKDKSEPRQVECILFAHIDENKVFEIRDDTGETLDERDMTDIDRRVIEDKRQEKLDL